MEPGEDSPRLYACLGGAHTARSTSAAHAERGTGHGSTDRVYTFTSRATDASGNVTEVTVKVFVPKDNHGHH